MITTDVIESSSRKLWMAAIKPPMYTVAIIPIWIGTAVAWSETRQINWQIFTTFLISAILIIAWLNLSNDVFDADTGIDKNKAHSLVNLTGNKSLIFLLSNLFLTLGILGILAIGWWQQDFTVIGLVLLACLLGYTYQGPPFRFGYLGLGEIICFITFGPLAVGAAYYSQSGSWSNTNWLASVIIGISTSLILFCSHFHQVQDDLAAGKKSPIVRLGTERGAQLLPWVCGSIFVIPLIMIFGGIFPVWTVLIGLSVPFAVQLCRHVGTHHAQPAIVSNCKFIAVSLHFFSGVLLGLGFLGSLL